MERLELRVVGRVQGVGYRWQAREEALRLGLTGWVRNRVDGSVHLLAEGPKPALLALLAWTRQGPVRARVEAVEAVWSAAEGTWDDFTITG
ncbi:MAG: acylphosphatase [bacterium]|nr:acylphosphatase [bacterium]